jgi:hypothetical protein
MKTMVCTLRFKDGNCLTATVSASTPDDEVQVHYSGQLELLCDRYETSNLPLLEFFLRARARYLGAKVEVVETGEYESTPRSTEQSPQPADSRYPNGEKWHATQQSSRHKPAGGV